MAREFIVSKVRMGQLQGLSGYQLEHFDDRVMMDGQRPVAVIGKDEFDVRYGDLRGVGNLMNVVEYGSNDPLFIAFEKIKMQVRLVGKATEDNIRTVQEQQGIIRYSKQLPNSQKPTGSYIEPTIENSDDVLDVPEIDRAIAHGKNLTRLF